MLQIEGIKNTELRQERRGNRTSYTMVMYRVLDLLSTRLLIVNIRKEYYSFFKLWKELHIWNENNLISIV